MKCPKCNSECQIITETKTTGKDFSITKAFCGFILFNWLGLLCGACGKGKQIKTVNYWICNQCGNRFKL